jgi:hypothetical protein
MHEMYCKQATYWKSCTHKAQQSTKKAPNWNVTGTHCELMHIYELKTYGFHQR